MFSIQKENSPQQPDIPIQKILKNNQIINFKQFIELLINDFEFRQFLNKTLSECPFPALFWEVKPVTNASLESDFEFALVQTSSLEGIKSDKEPFEHFLKTPDPAVAFLNLRGDAMLIVPTEMAEPQHYAHLGEFVRNAPPQQQDEFWKLVGQTYQAQINDAPKWLSTSGLGVYWLHVRVDTRPKYYKCLHFKHFYETKI